jgi:hypothetical protein
LGGLLATSAVLDLDIDDGLEVFNGFSSGADVLLSGFPISGHQLIEFVNKAGDAKFRGSFRSTNLDPPHALADPAELLKELNQGKSFVALVNLDFSDDEPMLAPVLEDPSRSRFNAQWVAILDVIVTGDGKSVIRIYQPYDNTERFYSWEAFEAAWARTAGNISEHGLLIIEPG